MSLKIYNITFILQKSRKLKWLERRNYFPVNLLSHPLFYIKKYLQQMFKEIVQQSGGKVNNQILMLCGRNVNTAVHFRSSLF